MTATAWFNFLSSNTIGYNDMADWAAVAASSLPPPRHENWKALSVQELAGTNEALTNSSYVLDFFVRGYWEPSLCGNAKLSQILAVRLWLASAILKGLHEQGENDLWAPFYAAMIIARLVTCSYGLQWLMSQLFKMRQDSMLNCADLTELTNDEAARTLRNKYGCCPCYSCLTADISPTYTSEKQGKLPESIQTTSFCAAGIRALAQKEGMTESDFLLRLLLEHTTKNTRPPA